MRKILSIIKYEFGETIRRPKAFLVLIFLVVLYESDLSPISAACAETGLRLNVFEMFVLMCTRSVNIILIPLIFTVLICDFPNCKADYFRMIRIGRREWLIGEIGFVIAISFVTLCVIFVGALLPVMSFSDATNAWSDFMTSLRDLFPEVYLHNLRVTLEASIVIHSRPVSAVIYSFVIMWLNLAVYGLLILLGAVFSKRAATLTAALALAFIGGCSTFFSSGIKWIFPITHTQLGLHFNSIFAKTSFPVWGSFAYLSALLAALILLCFLGLNKTQIGDEI